MKKILIIDDSRTVRQQVCAALAPGEFEILEAEDGIAGIYKIIQTPDLALVICDVNMPKMNGLDMLEKIKPKPGRASVPVLMLTTDGRVEQVERAKKAGAKGWMVKPFNPKILLMAVQKIVNAAVKTLPLTEPILGTQTVV